MPNLIVPTTQLSTLSEAPAQSAEAITPNDSNLIGPFRSVWVGGAGNVAALLVEDSAPITFNAVPAGTLLPIAVKKIMATGTTATNILGLK